MDQDILRILNEDDDLNKSFQKNEVDFNYNSANFKYLKFKNIQMVE